MFSKLCDYVIILSVFFFMIERSYQSIEEARAERQKILKKFIKKEEGAIKLVGGRSSNEGKINSSYFYCI